MTRKSKSSKVQPPAPPAKAKAARGSPSKSPCAAKDVESPSKPPTAAKLAGGSPSKALIEAKENRGFEPSTPAEAKQHSQSKPSDEHQDSRRDAVETHYNGADNSPKFSDDDSDDYSVNLPWGPIKYPPDYKKVKVSSSYFQLQLEINHIRYSELKHYRKLKSVQDKILSELEETNSRLRSIELARSDFSCYKHPVNQQTIKNKRAREESALLKFTRTSAGAPPLPFLEKDSPYYKFDTTNGVCLSNSKKRRHYPSDEHDISQEFRCLEPEDDLLYKIAGFTEYDIIVQIKSSVLLKVHMDPLIKDYNYDSFDKCLDDKIVDARINDMREKIRQQTRLDGNIFIELSTMTAVISNEGKDPTDEDNDIAKWEMRRTAKNYLKHNMIFFPLRMRHHWVLVVVNTKRHEIQILNSKVPAKGSEDERELLKEVHLLLAGLERYMKEAEGLNEHWPDLIMTSWTINLIEGLPEQKDNTSCALFMLKYAEHWNGRRLTKDFTQGMIDTFRRKLAAILMSSPNNEWNFKFRTTRRSPSI
ncbi:hypothetical protein EJB05_07393 [Eragrostis curvula]|uniref:Ubiquitin-like protease family profile domain-containing protein n=1 Tax=Eragrostis curvula TaxID=38414 RepID=A0A5J9WKJ2_9POAL|nr:hypothetical protein EJB05_07393 [Eragrostis curvula]